MKIRVVVDNESCGTLACEHGLSLWVEMAHHKFFFDLGQGDLFLQNAREMGIDVADAECALISHGHYDHGGGIATFLSANDHAPVYLHRAAFGSHYSEKEGRARYIGLDQQLARSERIKMVDDTLMLAPDVMLFSGVDERTLFSPANARILISRDDTMARDTFSHEMSAVIVEGGRRVLLAGCAHAGIINIMNRAEALLGAPLTHVVSGMHLMGVDDEQYLTRLAHALMERQCHYFTCHCTGIVPYEKLKEIMGSQITYTATSTLIEL